MRTELVDPVHYQLPVGETLIDLNSLLGQEISLVYSGRIFCIECARKTNKSFNVPAQYLKIFTRIGKNIRCNFQHRLPH